MTITDTTTPRTAKTPESAAALERRGRSVLLWSFLLCPCHLPLTLGVLGALLTGTSAGVVLREHRWIAGTVLTAAWLIGTFLGFRLLRRAQTMGGSCPVILDGGRWRSWWNRRVTEPTTSGSAQAPDTELSQPVDPDPRTTTFGAALTCIDGRTHEPVVAWIRQHAGVDHVDLITQPGMDAVLGTCPDAQCAELRGRLQVSIDAHGSRIIAVVGHDDCAANPVPPDQHRQQVRDAVGEVQRWAADTAHNDTEVVGLWVDQLGQVERIA
jgi:hypothetical protein